MITMITGKPGNGMTLYTGPVAEPSPVPTVDQERNRLLLEIKNAADYYFLHFAQAEYAGFVRGLQMAGQISKFSLIVFEAHASIVSEYAFQRLTKVFP